MSEEALSIFNTDIAETISNLTGKWVKK